jgi:hypothetical protein
MAIKQPDPVNAIATASKLYMLQNWTRYRTDDILGIFNAVETELTKLKPRGVALERRDYRSSDILYVDTYARGDDPKYRTTTPRERVFKDSTRYNEIRIVSPEGLGLSETERLASCLNVGVSLEGTPVPEEVLTWCIEEATLQYKGTHLAPTKYKPADSIGSDMVVVRVRAQHSPKLRYFDRPENKKPVMESGITRLERLATDKARQTYWTSNSFVRASEYMLRYSGELNRYAKKMGLPEYVSSAELNDLHTRIKALEAHCSALRTKLEK